MSDSRGRLCRWAPLVLGFFSVLSRGSAADWPGWRGDASGISGETGLPVSWDSQQNVIWKAPLPGQGNSSPIVWGGRVFLTAWDDGGKKRLVLALDAKDGKILWQRELDAAPVPPTNPKNGYASATPVTDGKRVYVFFDSPGLVALDFEGKVLWTRPLGPFKTPWNLASSPILYKDLAIQCCDHEGGGFIASIEAASGEVRWRTPRKGGLLFATPLLISHNGKHQVVVNGTTVFAYDPDTGKELWSARGMTDIFAPSAVFGDGLVYATSGRNGPTMAMDPSGSGDVTETHVKWLLTTGGPYVPSPLVYPCLILPSDNGTLRFVDAKGNVILKEQVRGHFTASPAGGDGKLYWPSERGDVYVVDVTQVASEKPAIRVLAVNALGENCLASPAVSGGRLFLRTVKHLFCIGGGEGAKPPAVAEAGRATFAELKKRYEAHPAENDADDVMARVEAVEAMGKLGDPQAIPFLQQAALHDRHWDVSEAAAKALGPYGERAVPAFTALLGDFRPYLKVIAAENLGRVGAVETAPALLKTAKDGNPLVRIAALRALAPMARASKAEAGKIAPALAHALEDKEGAVRVAAIEGLGLAAERLGGEREAVVRRLRQCAADRNPLVAQAAREALAKAFRER